MVEGRASSHGGINAVPSYPTRDHHTIQWSVGNISRESGRSACHAWPPRVQVVTRLETPDHWVTYCSVEDGGVSDPTKKTEVHRRKVANYY